MNLDSHEEMLPLASFIVDAGVPHRRPLRCAGGGYHGSSPVQTVYYESYGGRAGYQCHTSPHNGSRGSAAKFELHG